MKHKRAKPSKKINKKKIIIEERPKEINSLPQGGVTPKKAKSAKKLE